jgi:hypothetical protein
MYGGPRDIVWFRLGHDADRGHGRPP